ncbi:DUF4255 domain-containing protein [Paludibacterium paludis]|uniref:Pvc16 N-terminal domain-containing protein n=1 Tax=Paludibacterium paludis TaxID=1225769 RepID=A0A918P1L2_9NEIS|nr:DUF4255 domain-containing protein [Paludibacterium paludis]GGY13786.1 hypothetical protein GCM10011289_16420 [Paludibacterium paludis]
MIDRALSHLASQLNQHFRQRFTPAEDPVVVSNLLDPGGSPEMITGNKLVLFVSGIERETAAHRAQPAGMETAARMRGPEPMFLNLLVMCAATFSGRGYTEALRYLSDAIAFFQSRPVFDHHNSPDLDPRLERLVLNIENLSGSDMHSLWSLHGGRYLPSVLYRVRLICLDESPLTRRESLVQTPDIEVGRS